MLQELEAENKALWEEKKLASGILTKYKDEEKIVDDALKDIFTERRRIKDLQVCCCCPPPPPPPPSPLVATGHSISLSQLALLAPIPRLKEFQEVDLQLLACSRVIARCDDGINAKAMLRKACLIQSQTTSPCPFCIAGRGIRTACATCRFQDKRPLASRVIC